MLVCLRRVGIDGPGGVSKGRRTHCLGKLPPTQLQRVQGAESGRRAPGSS